MRLVTGVVILGCWKFSEKIISLVLMRLISESLNVCCNLHQNCLFLCNAFLASTITEFINFNFVQYANYFFFNYSHCFKKFNSFLPRALTFLRWTGGASHRVYGPQVSF